MYESKPVYECIHKEEEQCHYTYVTQFLPTREKECDQNYEKRCKVTKVRLELRKKLCLICSLFLQVTYNKVATNETHSHCYEPLVRQCDGEPAKRTVCKDWPETFCSTKYLQKKTDDDQFVSDTSCKRIQTRVCVPVNCAMVPGKPECFDKVLTVLHEVPEEVLSNLIF